MISSPHGTRSRYGAGCRCDDCRASNTLYAQARRLDPSFLEAKREYHRRWKRRRAGLSDDHVFRPVRPAVHGSPGMYKNHRCRCDACKAANTAYQREYVNRLAVTERCK